MFFCVIPILGSTMEGALLPVCSFFFSILLFVVYFLKKRVNLLENKMYGIMLICSVLDSFLVSFLQSLAINGIQNNELFIISIFNKIDFLLLIIFTNSILLYTIFISRKEKIKKIISFFTMLDIIAFIFIMINSIKIINDGLKYSVTGISVNITYILCGIYLVLSILISLKNINKTDKRFIPMYAIIFIAILLMFIFKYNPYLIVISITLTFLDYLMYYTIENPDVQMINELNKLNELNDKGNKEKSLFPIIPFRKLKNH